MVLLECATSYHANYLVNGGCRTYHPGIPDLIQVGEHQFVEAKPIETWQANMLFGWYALLLIHSHSNN